MAQDPIDELLKNSKVKAYAKTVAERRNISEKEVIQRELKKNGGEYLKQLVQKSIDEFKSQSNPIKKGVEPTKFTPIKLDESRIKIIEDYKKQDAVKERKTQIDSVDYTTSEKAKRLEAVTGQKSSYDPNGYPFKETVDAIKSVPSAAGKIAAQALVNIPSKITETVVKPVVDIPVSGVKAVVASTKEQNIINKYVANGLEALTDEEKIVVNKYLSKSSSKKSDTEFPKKELGRTKAYTDAQLKVAAKTAIDKIINSNGTITWNDLPAEFQKKGWSSEEIDRLQKEVQSQISSGNTDNTHTTGLNRPNTKVAAPSGSTPGTTSKNAAQQVVGGIPLIKIDPMPAITKEQSNNAAKIAEENRQKALTASGIPDKLENPRTVPEASTPPPKKEGYKFGMGEAASAAQLAIGLTGADKYSKIADNLIKNMPTDSIPLEASKAYADSQIQANKSLNEAQIGLTAARKAELEAKIQRVYASDSQISPMVRRLAVQQKYDSLLGLSSLDEQIRNENDLKYMKALEGANGEAARIASYKRQLFEDDTRKAELALSRAMQGEAAGAATTTAGLGNLVETIQLKEIERNRKFPTYNITTG